MVLISLNKAVTAYKTFSFLLFQMGWWRPRISPCQPEKQQYAAQWGSDPLICDLSSGSGLKCCWADGCMRALLLNSSGQRLTQQITLMDDNCGTSLSPTAEARPTGLQSSSVGVNGLCWSRLLRRRSCLICPGKSHKPQLPETDCWEGVLAPVNGSLRTGLFFHSGLDPDNTALFRISIV